MSNECEAPRPRAELPDNATSFVLCPLTPPYKAGLAGHLPVKYQISKINSCHLEFGFHLSFELWHLTFKLF
jgi:hypothetical protein